MRNPSFAGAGARRVLVAASVAVAVPLVSAARPGRMRQSAHPVAKPVLQQFTLAVPTREGKPTTTSIQLTVPSGVEIDSFEPAPDGSER